MTRSWWGWGLEGSALRDDELEGLGTLVAQRFGAQPTLLEPPDVAGLVLDRPRVELPRELNALAGDGDQHRDRLRHAHGQSFVDVARAVRGQIGSAPDLVVYPRRAADVASLMDWASSEGVPLVPFGGGSSVVGGVTPPEGPTVTVDMTRMSQLLDVDHVSRSAHVQGGALGPQVEGHLRPHGFTFRHFPQSWQWSTVAGWIATRAGGHFATGPTHVDDLVQSIGAQTPIGRWESRRLPGDGAGPAPDRLLLGSEGALGIITDAWLRVQPRPVFRSRASVHFATFREGALALRAVAQSGLAPANCRLLDPTEAALAGAGGQDAVLMLAFESADHPQDANLNRALELAYDFGGGSDRGATHVEGDRPGETDGAAGAWRESFLKAPYLRDGLIRLGMIVETFETAVTWDRFEELVQSATETAVNALGRLVGGGSVSVRVTHVYEDGAAPYFTVIAPAGGSDPVPLWMEVKQAVSEILLVTGGTITHHHAVGRDHEPWYRRQVPKPFAAALRAVKTTMDPAGICNPGVLGLE